VNGPAASSDRAAKPDPSRGFLRFAVVTAVYAGLAVALSWPLAAHLDTHVIGDVEHPGAKGDLFFQYGLQRQMDAGGFPRLDRTDLLLHPDGMALDPHVVFSLHQGINVALMVALGLLASHNLAALLILVANALSMHALVWARTRRTSFALLSGFLFGFGPYVFLKVQQGFIQKAVLFPIPLFVLFLLLGLERRRRSDLVLCGVFQALTLAVYPPYAVFNAAFGAVVVAGYGVSQGQLAGQLRRFLPLGVATVAMFAAVAWMLQGGPRTSALDMDRATFQLLGGFLDPLHPFRWLPYEHTFTFPPAALIPGLPLGFPVTVSVLAILGVVAGTRHSRALALAAAAMVVVMLGPFLRVGPDPGPSGGLLGPLPYYLLGKLPLGSVLKFPIRFYPWILIALLLAAGSILPALEAQLRKALPRGKMVAMGLGPVVLAIGVLENRLVFPEYARFHISEVGAPSFTQDLDAEAPVALLFVPEEPIFSNDYLYYAVTTARPLLNGYMDTPMSLSVPRAESPAEEQRAFVEQVRAREAGHIVVDMRFCGAHDDRERPERGEPCLERYGWLQRWCGPPRVYPEDRLAVFAVPDRPLGAD